MTSSNVFGPCHDVGVTALTVDVAGYVLKFSMWAGAERREGESDFNQIDSLIDQRAALVSVRVSSK